jgi:hypothetical protein
MRVPEDPTCQECSDIYVIAPDGSAIAAPDPQRRQPSSCLNGALAVGAMALAVRRLRRASSSGVARVTADGGS